MQLTISAVSNKGCVREHNEDMVLIGSNIFRDNEMKMVVDLQGEDGKFFVAVADGMGGHNAGEIASRIVLQEMAERIDTLEGGLNEKELADRFAEWGREIHSYILEEGNKDAEKKGMGATLIGVLFYNNMAYYINAGDSRLYRLRGGYLTQISEDHSLKKLTGDDDVPSNIILNSFGGGDKIFIDFAQVGKKLIDEDILLLCSDGLTDMLTDEEIEGILNTQENAVRKLLTEAKNKGGKDNISIVTVKIKE
jgi:protein phosphatase